MRQPWRWGGLVGILLLLAAGCGAPSAPAPSATPTDGGPPTAGPPAPLSEGVLVGGLQTSGLPVEQVRVFTAETDPDRLLGRPGQYIRKYAWTDRRAGASPVTLEVFSDAAALATRAKDLEEAAKRSPDAAQYLYADASRLALLRVPHELTPDQAKEYQAWLLGLRR